VQKSNKRIVATTFCPGSVHDFALFKQSALPLQEETCCLGDSGYTGLQKQHENSRTPHKKSKHHPLTPEQLQHNKQLARERLDVEHIIGWLIIGWLKRFHILCGPYRYLVWPVSISCVARIDILCGPYRNRRKRLTLRFNLIAALYNAHLDL
jgi:hypothetical protein